MSTPDPTPADVPVLSDGVLTLRAHRDDDVPAIVEQCTDATMAAFVPLPRPYGPEQAREYLKVVRDGWADGSRLSWAIDVPDAATPGGARFGGSIDYRPRGDGVAEVGFGLHPTARGHGHMVRAVRLVLDHAFGAGIRLVTWRAVVGNWASRRTAWSCGFRFEGVQRGALAHPDGPQDAWVATLAADEPREPAGPWHVPHVLEAGGGVRLRPWRDDDVLPAELDPDTAAFLPVAPSAADYREWLAQVRDDMAQGHSIRWAIVAGDETPGTPVLGGIHVFGLGDRRRPGGRLGYWLAPSARGRGVATAAVRTVLAHAFAPAAAGGLGLPHVRADADVANQPSARVLRSAGFTPCGVLRRETEARVAGHGDMLECEVLPADLNGARSRPVWRLLPGETLTDGVVVLSPFDEPDLPVMTDLLREPDASPGADGDDAAAWRRRLRGAQAIGRAVTWAIRVAADDDGSGADPSFVPVGTIGAFRLDDPFFADGAEIGYWVRASHRRRGIATRATRLVTDHLLAPVEAGGAGLRRLTAMTSPENVASQAVLGACGLTRWAVEPHAVPPGSFGTTRSPFQGDMPSSDRWRYERVSLGG